MPRALHIDTQRLGNRTSLSHSLLILLPSRHFGDLAFEPSLPACSTVLENIRRVFPDPTVFGAWQRLIAEELLLRSQTGGTIPDDWLAHFGSTSPFDDLPAHPLSRLIEAPAACALFPLATLDPSSAPATGRAWAFAGHGDPLLVSPIPAWGGNSGALAAWLATKALDTDPVCRRRLAQDWLVSGESMPDDNRVGRIQLGNKLALCTLSPNLHKRLWLLPADNRDDLPLRFPGRGYRLAYDRSSAWNHITGSGMQGEGQGSWPVCKAYHSFCSGAREPALAGALLSVVASPDIPVHLWASSAEVSRKSAVDVAFILEKLGTGLPIPHTIDSADMRHAEAQLVEVLEPVLETGAKVLFNVTQGNRLMSFAVHSLARRFENLLMIYRDCDADMFEFTMIRYEGGTPVTSVMTGTPAPTQAQWNWKCLFTANGNISPAALLENIITNLRKNETENAYQET